MIPCFILTTRECRDRQRALSQELEASGLDLAPVWVVGRRRRSLSHAKGFNLLKFQQRYLYQARPGQIGCTLGHLRIMRRFIKSGEPWALVLEDDAADLARLKEIIPRIETLLTDEKPIVALFSGRYWWKGLPGSSGIVEIFDADLSHAYLVNRRGAALLLEMERRDGAWWLADDWKLFRERGMLVYAAYPALCRQLSGSRFESAIPQPPPRKEFPVSAGLRDAWLNLASWSRIKWTGLRRLACAMSGHFVAAL